MTWLADHSIRVAALILVVSAGSLMARRASPHSRLYAWTIVLYLAMAMPLLSTVLPHVPVPLALRDPVIVLVSPDSIDVEPLRQAAVSATPGQSSSTLPWLLALYLAGAALFFTRFAAGTALTRRFRHRAQLVDDPSLVAEVQALSSAMGLARLPQVVQHASVHVPFVSGVFRPALILPDSWTGWDASTRRAVLTHELSHLVRRDLWTMRAASLYCAVTWLNPMSWWLRRKLETLAERASDDAVLASGVDPTAYAEMLLQFFAAAQCAPGRADWRLAMARRGGAEAGKRVGRVLNAREGGNVRFGIAGRVLIGLGVVLAAVPAITLSASGSDIVAIQAVDRGLDLRRAQVAPITSGSENQAALRPMTRQQIKQLKLDRVNLTPVLTREVELIPQSREQEQEPEPWRSTRKGTDADVVAPEMTRSVNPKYTADALRAKIEGWITVEAIVSPEGNVTAARVIKSLDRVFGLDDEAVKTAMLWKFLPGSYQGQPVALRVIIEMQFTMRRN